MAIGIRLGTSRTLVVIAFTAVAITLLFVGGGRTAYAQSAGADAGETLSLEMVLTPWASTPGDRVLLTLFMRNRGFSAAAPDVFIQLPSEVSPEIESLPSGTNYNFANGGVSWQPYVEALGGTDQVEIWLEVKAAQVHETERNLLATVRNGNEEWTKSATFWIGSLPSVSIVFDPPQVSIGQPVRLIANVTGPGPTTQTWSFDDGRIVSANNPEVVFATAGSHTVTLQLANPLGTTIATNRLEILAEPVALFSTTDSTTLADAAISFTNNSGGEPPLRYSWDFGDGSFSSERNPTHVFSSPGLYPVTLRVDNAHGQSAASAFVQIGDPPSLEYSIDDYQDLGELLTGKVLNPQPAVEYTWDMGDGRYLSGEQVSHRYWMPGDYVITVIARNEFGETRAPKWIRIGYDILHYFIPLMTGDYYTNAGLDEEQSLTLVEGAVNIGLGPLPELQPVEFAAGTTPVEQLFVYINQARRLYNLRSLTYVHSLSVAAQAHADDMAANGFTAHIGSDGSTPAYRQQVAGYKGGYGGEATAWGMADPIEPVRFWLTSPPHRAIILNPAAAEVGLGFATNFDAPSVWYWTAEFASMDLPVVAASAPVAVEPEPVYVLQLLGPPQGGEFALDEDTVLVFSWSWNGGLSEGQRFALYLNSGGRTFQAGVVRGSQSSGHYQFTVRASALPVAPGPYRWQVKLEDSGQGSVLIDSEIWQVNFTSPAENIESQLPGQPTPIDPTAGEPAAPTPPPSDTDTPAPPPAIPEATPVPNTTP